MEKNYNIPDKRIGFYGTGIFDVNQSDLELLSSIVEPIKKFIVSDNTAPVHVSCRYLGYYEDVKEAELEQVKPLLKNIYKDYLPQQCKIVSLYGSWVKQPSWHRKLIFAKIDPLNLIRLHEELLKATPNFPVFKSVEANNFAPHITIAELSLEYFCNVPMEVSDYVGNFSREISIVFNKSYFWDKNGVKEF